MVVMTLPQLLELLLVVSLGVIGFSVTVRFMMDQSLASLWTNYIQSEKDDANKGMHRLKDAKLDWSIEPIEGGYVATPPDMAVKIDEKGPLFVPQTPMMVQGEEAMNQLRREIQQWRENAHFTNNSYDQLQDTEGYQRYVRAISGQ